MTKSLIATALCVLLAAPISAQKASSEDAWRTFAAHLEPMRL